MDLGFLTIEKPRWYTATLIVLAGMGFMDAAYLTVNHYLDLRTICFSLTQCDRVLQSSYATIAGVPLALIGALYYLVVIGLVVWHTRQPGPKAWLLLLGILTFAFLTSGYLIFLQLAVIQAICLYCVTSAVLTSLLFMLTGLGTYHMFLAAEDKRSGK